MLEKRARLVVRCQKAHHFRPDLRIARAGVIDVLRARGWLLQQRLVEDRPQAPVPIGLVHGRILVCVSGGVKPGRFLAVRFLIWRTLNEMSEPARVTDLLVEWGHGNEAAHAEMLPLVYAELRRLAAGYMFLERGDHTLQPTALVHEAYLRLVDQRRVDWRNRAQFVGVAAMIMRRILVNHARDRAAAKRGGGVERVSLTVAVDAFDRSELDLVSLHEALERLTALEPRAGRIVELKSHEDATIADAVDRRVLL